MGRGEGSSPRVRGKRKIVIPDNTFFRLIPACAGKTQRRPSFCRPGRAHPRAGGENALGGQYVFGDMGSSPRWRGKLLDACENVANRGLIPALAGKTCFIVCAPFTLGAHPRAGGENPSFAMVPIHEPGSSPRWRGKRVLSSARHSPSGLIPALAGKTSGTGEHRSLRKAHPRAGGENDFTRGKSFHNWWLIPALAGKTVLSASYG